MNDTRKHLMRKLPRNYFADSPTNFAAPANPGPTPGTGAVTCREGVEGPGAASTFATVPQRHVRPDVATFGAADSLQERSDTKPTATNATPSAAPILSSDGCAGVCTNGEPVAAVPSRGDGTSVLSEGERQQLHAARVIYGRATA